MKQRIVELRKLLNEYSYAYYTADNSLVSDAQYDILYNELLALERQYPEYHDPNSITQKVGGEVLAAFEKVKHPNAMYSLGNCYNYEDLLAFDTRVVNEVGVVSYCVELKIDGVAMSLLYRNGLLYQALTRGDGEFGENVTSNVKTIKALPLAITNNNDIEIRGEVYLSKKQLEKINSQRKQESLELLLNCRNAASGSVRQLDSKVAAKRNLSAFWYQVIAAESLEFTAHSETLNWLDSLGFVTNSLRKVCINIQEVWDFILNISEQRFLLGYDIDGVVVKVDSLEAQMQLGYTIKVPKWATAYKFPAQVVESIIEDIFVTVGRTGKVTPNAKLRSVFVGGTNVAAAQLHNQDYIASKDLRIGDTVLVRKAGDIIPEVYKVVLEYRTDAAKVWEFPKNCPDCNSELHRLAGESDHFCFNPDCPARVMESIIHFCSRDCLNIDGFGEKTIQHFYHLGWLTKIEDLLSIETHQQDIIDTKGYGEKSYQRIISGLTAAKLLPFDKVLNGLGIRHIGEKASKILAKEFGGIDNLMAANVEQIANIYDMGGVKAASIKFFLDDEKNGKLIQKLKAAGFIMHSEKQEVSQSYFSNMRIVLTGTSTKLQRQQAQTILEKLGANCSGSVSKETSLVIFGDKAGSKLVKAQQLGVKCIDEVEFLQLLKNERVLDE